MVSCLFYWFAPHYHTCILTEVKIKKFSYNNKNIVQRETKALELMDGRTHKFVFVANCDESLHFTILCVPSTKKRREIIPRKGMRIDGMENRIKRVR